MAAAAEMVEKAKGNLNDIACVVEILGTKARERIDRDYINYFTLIDMEFKKTRNGWVVVNSRI